MQGVNAVLPRYFADVDRVMDLESRIVHCEVTLQGFTMAELTKRPHSLNQSERQTDGEALVAYVVGQSRGAKVNLPQSHPKERESFLRGEKMFFKGGPYDFACATCHGVDGQRIRLQDPPNFQKVDNAQRAFTTWARVSRARGQCAPCSGACSTASCQRMPEMEFLSQASIDLITYGREGERRHHGRTRDQALNRTRRKHRAKKQFVIGAGLVATVRSRTVGCATGPSSPPAAKAPTDAEIVAIMKACSGLAPRRASRGWTVAVAAGLHRSLAHRQTARRSAGEVAGGRDGLGEVSDRRQVSPGDWKRG